MPNKNPLSEKDKQNITDFYLAGNSTKVTAKHMGISSVTLRKILDEKGVRRRGHRESRIKYHIDESYFEKIDTPEKAQILGFFAADGCLYQRKRSPTTERLTVIGISEVDIEYLKWIASQWKTDNPISIEKKAKNGLINGRKANRTKMVRLATYSQKIYEDLEKLGMSERKSLTLLFPTEDQVPREFQRDFIRGYFEGDGGISLHLENKINLCVCGTPEFNQTLSDIIRRDLGINSYFGADERPRINYCTLIMSGPKNCLRFLEWIFKDCSYKMERKWKTYLDFRAKFDENLDFITTPERAAETSKRRSAAFHSRTPETQQRCVKAIKDSNRHLYLKFHIKSPSGQIYQSGAAKPFCKEFGLSLFAIRLVAKEGKEIAALRDWSIPTPEEITAAQSAGAIIEKFY